LNWLEYLSAFLHADIDHSEPVVSYAMPYFVEMGRIIQKTDRRLQATVITIIIIDCKENSLTSGMDLGRGGYCTPQGVGDG
jgi:hypothetical protein